ncbi:MAG: hypothetical protein KJ017_01150 [Alphaproteobacteria bacterium]|nr:hypothetical protein [Alphaproteobacteria bacterium]
MNDHSNADEDAKALLLGTAPERPADVEDLLRSVEYKRAHDRPALHLEATAFFGRGLVVLTNRTMQQIWLIAYLSWKTLHEQSGFVIVALARKLPYDTSLYKKNDRYIGQVDRLGQALTDLRTADAGSNPWPSDVPRLDPDLSELRDEEDRAAYDLGCFAAAFVLLHETRHAIKRAQGDEYGGVAEELECDRYAITFLLDRCDQYAGQNNYEPIRVLRKRAMGVFLGLAVTFESTELGLWLPSDSHPSAYVRIQQLVRIVEANITDPNDDFWLFATCVLLSKARRDNQIHGTIPFQTTRSLFDMVLELMQPD